ncbi:MAG: betaine/proline/choline family ABC transporter ATP-binding protein [Candidatus Hydrogenedentes bacterium]|nr:betaine/proline/choline family ABC transporter ATP-binding protein [Candidatus Hydrogenedentota bacterium]
MFKQLIKHYASASVEVLARATLEDMAILSALRDSFEENTESKTRLDFVPNLIEAWLSVRAKASSEAETLRLQPLLGGIAHKLADSRGEGLNRSEFDLLNSARDLIERADASTHFAHISRLLALHSEAAAQAASSLPLQPGLSGFEGQIHIISTENLMKARAQTVGTFSGLHLPSRGPVLTLQGDVRVLDQVPDNCTLVVDGGSCTVSGYVLGRIACSGGCEVRETVAGVIIANRGDIRARAILNRAIIVAKLGSVHTERTEDPELVFGGEKIIINGEDIRSYNKKQLIKLRRNTIGMVFQHFGLFPHRNVIDNVAYGLKVRGVAKEERYARAREVIEKVGLKGWEDYFPDALSGGMQQRVGIARALANDPDILLMDEPFSGLDPLIRRQMQDELVDIQAELQKTILFVTHDLDEALKLGSRIAIMKDGEIIQTGVPEEVVTSPAGEYVREFVRDASPAKVLTAGTIMTEPDVIIYEWQGPKTALHLLKTGKKDYAFLVTRAHKLLGLVTAKRLTELIEKKGSAIIDALEPDIVTCPPDMLLEDLLGLVVASEHPIPVVDEQGKLLGEIHSGIILSNMVQYKEAETEEIEAEETKADA